MNFKEDALELKSPMLTTGDIHIWCISLRQSLYRIEELSQLLSEDERHRVKRFRFSKDQQAFVVRRGLLRKILGDCLSTDPKKLVFIYGDHGKPEITNTFGNANVHFNQSHSGNLTLFALTLDQRIGVDIEFIHEVPELDQIAEIILSEYEYSIFKKLSPKDKKEAFFYYWTRKEAITKAIGIGLSHPPNSFTTSIAPGKPASLITLKMNKNEESSWLLQSLDLDPDYAAAIAVEDNKFGFKIFHSDTLVEPSHFFSQVSKDKPCC
jgi:4'-phosphopantetheinyl transferase